MKQATVELFLDLFQSNQYLPVSQAFHEKFPVSQEIDALLQKRPPCLPSLLRQRYLSNKLAKLLENLKFSAP